MTLIWSCLCAHFHRAAPELALIFKSSEYTLRALTLLVGILTSMTLKESLYRYRNCYAALIGFKDELCSLWYYMQLQVIRSPPLKLLLDAHMVWYNMGLLQYLYEKTDEPEVEGVEVIRRDFIPRDLKRCALFADYGQGYALCWL